jgi:hypothetical protein
MQQSNHGSAGAENSRINLPGDDGAVLDVFLETAHDALLLPLTSECIRFRFPATT